MTAGGLIQIVTATGEQDRYLTWDPNFSYFNATYRRHTNFSTETIEEVYYNSEGFGKQARCIIPRKGDLITNMVLYVKLGSLNPEFSSKLNKNRSTVHKNNTRIIKNGCITYNKCTCTQCLYEEYQKELTYGWTNALGHALIKSVCIEIGGQRIDRQYGEWFEIWSELTLTGPHRDTYFEMIGKVDNESFRATTFSGEMELYIPLQFWFCRHYGLALPIMSLFYHHVELVVDFRSFNELWVSNKKDVCSPTVPEFKSQIYIDYVYLDIDERKAFYERSNTYLIEQLQCIDSCNILGRTFNMALDNLNHPVKELIWIFQRNDVVGPSDGLYTGTMYPKGNDWFNFSTRQVPIFKAQMKEDAFKYAKITFNGTDRFREKSARYFRLYHPYRYHTRGPFNFIYLYSFSLHPENLNPSGQMNFSRVSNSNLHIQMNNKLSHVEYAVRLYAVNYNILVITTGMGGLLFNN